MHVHFLDPYQPGESPVHRLDARVKFVLTLAFILTAALTPVNAWPIYILLLAIIISVEILSELAYSVKTVSNGEKAVEYLRNNTVDLLLLDMIMDPGIDGLDTYKQVVEFNPGQKAIIVSGFSETDRVKEAKRLGAGQYIRKPYTLEKIGTAIRTELDK